MWVWSVFAAALVTLVGGGYIITTPRIWVAEQATTVCVYHVRAVGQPEEHLKVTIQDRDRMNLTTAVLPIQQGQTSKCYDVHLPRSKSIWSGNIVFEGKIGESTINDTRNVRIRTSRDTVFVQTDKYLYQPGQIVRVRILTLEAPSLKILTENYRSVHVDTPSGTRIWQKLDVDNTRGLVHLEFQLNKEVEEGTYVIYVKSQNNETEQQLFKVEEYVPPRFEVTIIPQKDVLATDKKASVRVCAKYTFGQPVRGNASIIVRHSWWFSPSNREITKHEKIVGCHDFEFCLKELDINTGYLPYQLQVRATVTEEGTNITSEEERHYIKINRVALLFEKESREEYVKPGLPYTAKVLVKHVNGSHAAHEPLSVCLWEVCRNMTTDSLGRLTVYVPPNAFKASNYSNRWTANRLEVKSLRYPYIPVENSGGGVGSYGGFLMSESKTSYYLERYYSPTNSSILLRVDQNNLDCKKGGNKLELDLLYSAYRQRRANITVQLISRGQIQYQETSEYEFVECSLPFKDSQFLTPMKYPRDVVVGLFKIPVHLENSYSPEVKVLVWYTRDDGEVVSDLAVINIQSCLDNNVSMSWSVAKAEPGDPAMLTVSAEPNSFCSYGVVDKSVELLSNQYDGLTVDGIFGHIRRYQLNQWTHSQSDDDHYCRFKEIIFPEENCTETTEIPGIISSEDEPGASKVFPQYHYRYTSDYVDALKIFDDSGLFFVTDLTVETRPCRQEDRPIYIEARPPPPSPTRPGIIAQTVTQSIAAGIAGTTTGFGGSAEEDGQANKQQEEQSDPRTYFPETWLWDLIPVPDVGESAQYLTLPDTVTEWVGKTVCVHPQKGVGISAKTSIITFTPFFAELTLPPSVKRGEILPVKVSVFNYQNTSLPVKLVLEASPDFDILGETGEEVVASGARSACVPPSDKVTHTIRISPKEIGDVNLTVKAFVDNSFPEKCGPEEKVCKRDVLVKPIKVEAEGFPREKAWTKYICSKDLENNVDALEVWRVEPPANIVEGSERGFVTASGDLLGPSLDNLDGMIQMPYGCGEQNMVRFAPNIFILQYLEASQQLTLEIVDRSKEYMQQGYQRQLRYRHNDGSYSAFGGSDSSGSTWLTAFVVKSFAQARQYIFIGEKDLNVSMNWLQQQQAKSGCYNSVGKVFNKGLKGGIGQSSSAAPLTAYIIMALLEAGEDPKSTEIHNAIACLLKEERLSTYTRAIASYALALARHSEAENYLQKLLGEATKTSNTIFWKVPEGNSVAVETAGYAVLAMMALDSIRYDTEALKVVKWISSARNSHGGFVSTQDTVVALQALASYSSTLDQGGSNLTITVEAENLQHSFAVNEKNKILQQFVMLPTLPTNVALDMTGQGCALLQAVLRYNVPVPDPADAFSLSVKSRTVPDRQCVTKEITACASYLLSDEKSNMAILEVKLVSGYMPDKDDLKKVVNSSELFKKYEVDGSMVLFYIDELMSENLCATFKVIREVDVENPKPGSVRVYDYYQPEFVLDESYVLPSARECFQIWIPQPLPPALEPSTSTSSAIQSTTTIASTPPIAN